MLSLGNAAGAFCVGLVSGDEVVVFLIFLEGSGAVSSSSSSMMCCNLF